MLNFRKLTIEDKEIIEKATNIKGEFACDNSFLNLFIWQDYYNNSVAFCDNQIIIKSDSEKGEIFFLPFGDDFYKGMDMIFKYTKEPCFFVSEGTRLEMFKEKWGDFYEAREVRDAFDYIYLREDLVKLQGKKYHSKRNHISAFSRKYDWRYEKITAKNIDDVRLCANKWYSENLDPQDETMLDEQKGLEFIFKNYDSLSVLGGAIYIDEKVVAFTLGTPINDEVFDIQIEKAIAEYKSAYPVINQAFAENELGDFKYLNREDDLGLEGLRKAKLSYKPQFLLKKYFLKAVKK